MKYIAKTRAKAIEKAKNIIREQRENNRMPGEYSVNNVTAMCHCGETPGISMIAWQTDPNRSFTALVAICKTCYT